MPDNWGFVLTAYGLTAVVLGAYWRRLRRREREVARLARREARRPRARAPSGGGSTPPLQ